MKLLLSILFFTSCTFGSTAQYLAAAKVSNEYSVYPSSGTVTEVKRHKQSTVSSVGTCALLGGIAISIVGYIEVKNANQSVGPYTFVNQDKQNRGKAIEIIGGGVFTAGLLMIIIDAVNRHPQEGKMSIIAPKSNEVGIAYNF